MLAQLSIIVPTLDEAAALPALLADLQPLRAAGAELIVCDGGSRDGTPALAAALSDRVLDCARGRALQMNAGAACARGRLLLFLHADCRLDAACVAELQSLPPDPGWGFFAPRLRGRSRWLPVIAAFMGTRSRLTGIATGDQGLLVERALFDIVGGFPSQPLMEDVEISARLRRLRRPRALVARLESSGRRWDRDGALRTIALMWWLRLRYACGADPALLAGIYHAD